MEEKRKATDIYIKPDISGFSVISFEEGKDIIEKGEEAAMKVLDTLRALGVGHPLTHKPDKLQDSLYIEQIKIDGLKIYTNSYVIGKLNFKPGSKISYEDFNDGITSLNATQNFNAISYCFDEGVKHGEIRLKCTLGKTL